MNFEYLFVYLFFRNKVVKIVKVVGNKEIKY